MNAISSVWHASHIHICIYIYLNYVNIFLSLLLSWVWFFKSGVRQNDLKLRPASPPFACSPVLALLQNVTGRFLHSQRKNSVATRHKSLITHDRMTTVTVSLQQLIQMATEPQAWMQALPIADLLEVKICSLTRKNGSEEIFLVTSWCHNVHGPF